MDFPTKAQLDAFSTYNQQFINRMIGRLGTIDVPAISQPTACMANVWHLVDREDGTQYAIPGDQWQAYQTERGVCWQCGDELAPGAHFCITCGAELPAATGETERLYVPPAIGATERL